MTNAEPAMWLKLLIVAVVFCAILVMLKCKYRTRFASLAVLMFCAGMIFYLRGAQRISLPTAPNQVRFTSSQESVANAEGDASLDALWERLTRSKINLDGETNAELTADPKAEAEQYVPSNAAAANSQVREPPDWVVHPPKRVGLLLRESVASDPFVTDAECRHQLEQELIPTAVAEHLSDLASARMGHTVTIASPLTVGIGLDYIFREICRDEFTATLETSVGEMKKKHVLLEFSPSVDKYLVEAWLRSERHERFAFFGRIAGLSLTGLAIAYGLLRFDTWSKGYYSKQLLVGSLLAIIALTVMLLRS